jgi:hypothetical protein
MLVQRVDLGTEMLLERRNRFQCQLHRRGWGRQFYASTECCRSCDELGDLDQQSMHQAEGVHQQMALATLDQLAAIKAALKPTPLNRLDGLAVQDCGGWLRIATSGPTDIRSQVVVPLLPGAVVTPATAVGPGSALRDKLTRDHPPLSATPRHIADGIEDSMHVGARPAKRFGCGQERLRDCPLCAA